MRVFLSGDVMLGRGIDQIMAHPGDPTLYEPWAKSALRYVELAEQRSGPIPRAVGSAHVWGDALEALDDAAVGARLINLETAVTDRGVPWPDKGIHYRMHPENVAAITAARVDCCALANNHVLDWSYPGLNQTLDSLHRAGLAPAGAGRDATKAAAPTRIDTSSGHHLVVVAVGTASAGIPQEWAAGPNRPGVNLVALSDDNLERVSDTVSAATRPGDLVIVSIHWGPNWGYRIPRAHRWFARSLIDRVDVNVVHGHSTHHPIGIEVYHGRLILYGCGDLINDYEGIPGHEQFRPDLGILYLADLDPASGALQGLELIPMRVRRFRLEHAPFEAATWLATVLSRESRPLGVAVGRNPEGSLEAHW